MFSRRQLVQQIVEKFGGDMITLSSPGIASMLAFKSGAAKVFHLMPDDTDDMSEAIEKVAKKIKAELDSIETVITATLTKMSALNFKVTPLMMCYQKSARS